MRRTPGPKEAKVSARVYRYVDQELAETENVPVDVVFRYIVDQHGKEAIEELSDFEESPLPAVRSWWEDDGRSVVEGEQYGDPRSGTFLNQRKVTDLREYKEELRSFIDSMERGLGKDDEKWALSWMVISRRDDLLSEAEDGAISDWASGD